MARRLKLFVVVPLPTNCFPTLRAGLEINSSSGWSMKRNNNRKTEISGYQISEAVSQLTFFSAFKIFSLSRDQNAPAPIPFPVGVSPENLNR